MTLTDRPHKSFGLRLYLGLTERGAGLAQRHLKKRLKRGKEDPDRIGEKEGRPTLPRPDGPLVWLHAVGVGEVLALPGLAQALRQAASGLTVLITSSSRTSAQALAPNLPDGVLHQYLPLDIGPWRRAFLDHWRPDLSVWAERDLWPGFICELAHRRIPLALVNGRMDEASYRAKQRLSGLFRDLYSKFDLVEAQDNESAHHFAQLGSPDPQVTGSLKTAAAPLADQPQTRTQLETLFQGRPIWIAASTHLGEEEIIAHAHQMVLDKQPNACLILAPRDPDRAQEAQAELQTHTINAEILPNDNIPTQTEQAYIVAQIGQLGLWYRLADRAFVGGSLCDVGGHNPWEPARLDAAILHGTNIQNFEPDYAALHAENAALQINDAADLARALIDQATLGMRANAANLANRNADLPRAMARRLLALMGIHA